MNMQTIQIMILLLDSFIKLAPWRIVTETMDRIGYSASESLARSLVVIAVACAGLCAIPPTSIFGADPADRLSRRRDGVAYAIGSPLFSHILFGFYLGVMVWGGLWLRDRNLRTLMPLRADLPDRRWKGGSVPCLRSLPSSPSCLRSPFAIVLILAATKPDTFSVQRVGDSAGAAGRNFPLINDFHQWGTGRPGRTRIPR